MSKRQDGGTALNGIDIERRHDLARTMSSPDQLEAFSGPWEATCEWMGGFRSRSVARSHVIDFDEPVDLGSDDQAPTPHEHLISALGGCLVAGVVLHATLRSIQLHTLRVHLEASFESILRWAGLEEAGNPGLHRVTVRGTIGGDAPDEVLRSIWAQAVSSSPVQNTISRPTPVLTQVEIVD